MAGRSQYTDADRARVYVALVTADWQVKRAARDTGYPITTVRRWKSDFQAGNLPSQEAVEAQSDAFVSEMEEVRQEALSSLRTKIPDAKPSELITIVGVLDDKIMRAKGLATTRVDHVHTLPSREEMSELLLGAVEGAISAAANRQHEIVDAEVVEVTEPRALPRGSA